MDLKNIIFNPHKKHYKRYKGVKNLRKGYVNIVNSDKPLLF